MRDTCSPAAMQGLERRQSMTTWGIVALAVFVAVGMAEWSKRQAASETVIDPAVMEQAVKMAAAAAANVKVNVNVNESEKRISKSGNEAATIQTSAGADR